MPYGFDFTAGGGTIVTKAFGGVVGKAAASSYSLCADGRDEPISRSVGGTRSEVCWAAITNDGRFGYVTSFGDGTISSSMIGEEGSIELHDPVAGSTGLGAKGIRDEAITRDGRFLYAIDAHAQQGLRLDGRRARPTGADRRVRGRPPRPLRGWPSADRHETTT